jgi:uncharacterized protein YkwD
MRRYAVVVAALVAPLSPLTAAARAAVHPARANGGCTGADIVPGSSDVKAARSATLCLLNVQRRLHGLPSLHAQFSLRHAAQSYSASMVEMDFFNHVSPSGSTLTARVKSTAYLKGTFRTYRLGENIGYGAGTLSSPRRMVDAWMHSSGHRANILNRRFRDIGIGIAMGTPVGANGGATYTTDFGTRTR